MARRHEDPDFSRDIENAELVQAVTELLKKAGVKGVRGVGPINADRTSCKVLLSGKKTTKVPARLEVTLANKKRFGLKLQVEEKVGIPKLFSGPVPKPWQYSGPLMGGDPIWNDVAHQSGTITFAATAGSPIDIEGKACANQSVTCSHVLDFGGPVSVSTSRYPNSMKLQWVTSPPTGKKWIDLSGADIQPGVPFSPLEVRGLRHIKGVVQPTTGIRVSKYGATTGLTSGLDLGWAQRQLTDKTKKFFTVRVVSGYFATVGDSGAPVLDADRNFLGLVVSGIPGKLDETYYVPAVPNGQVPPSMASTGFPDPSYFTINGI